jgi:Asp-tRNA(Asn)/Glu-tRNA(Gln) amidotransferase A subunit family amidase
MLGSKFMRIPQLTKLLSLGDIDPLSYLSELETITVQNEPLVNAFLPEDERFGRLKQEFNNNYKKYPNAEVRPKLFCLPVGVKDIYHVDGFSTFAGSSIPPEVLSGNEASVVTKLKDLGSIIFGKTVTTEFAYFAPGPTKNPHNLNHTPGGSSSGSAAAVAAGIVPFAFGTQTIGSIIRPASYCGVVGFKPTYNRIPKDGVIPLSPSVDTIGYFTTDTSDARYMASHLCNGWQEKIRINEHPVLGVTDGPYLMEADSEMLDHLDSICSQLSRSGYKIKKLGVMSDFTDIYQRHNVIVAKEAAQTHETWFSKFGDRYHPKTIELIKHGQDIDHDEYMVALRGRDKLCAELTEIMELENVDVWLSPPAKGPAPIGLESTGDPVMNLPWTHCGFPALNIPAGFSKSNLPMGLQISAGWYQDEALLYWGESIERSIQERV